MGRVKMNATTVPLLSLMDIAAGYGETQVLWGVSLAVRGGQVTALLGPNGAGKTTTLRVIAGLLPAWGGTLTFDGQDITRLPPHERVDRGIVLVPEGRQLWPRMTVEENLLLGAYRPHLRARIPQNLERVYTLFPRLAERRRQLAGTLSGGEQQMVALGRGMMAEPRVLLLDEPSLGLAPRVVADMFAVIRAIAEQGVTILLVEQAVTNALAVAQYGYVLETGRIVLEGETAQLRANPQIQQAYLGVLPT